MWPNELAKLLLLLLLSTIITPENTVSIEKNCTLHQLHAQIVASTKLPAKAKAS
jgi:hypothetical protein